MATISDIEWTEVTWNPVTGCSIMSAGCTNCYAMRMAARLQSMDHPSYRNLTRKSGRRHVWTGNVNLVEHALELPRSWKKPRIVFVNSMSDLFHPNVPFEFIEQVWSVMEVESRHTFQLLTKRPDRMREFLISRQRAVARNVWIGTSVEDARVKDRIRFLRQCPAEVRFVSFEPLIGDVGRVSLSGIDWAIVGGESGPNSRPMSEAWVNRIYDLCRASGVSFFFKQWGGVNKKKTGREYRGQTWDEMPVREFA
ncbi:DUF5131 family protein [Parvularcula lutaonensis]|uniref:DUF5131 family protein n=1 Tax=Parvularcula lutaonensis TaxID=491923 RepID=A0ABV7MCS2_9PROT|nr:phage Gp37/Gp68 family protein [Parvularcula lutaonensis]GGY51534.1 hypothetical protein GCM10007148_20540 [Parvularcula lutaonensis]